VPAQASSGKIYACYSKSTHVMHYSKKAHCSSGKLLSWNKMGPQGAQGAKGHQGPQGPQGAQGPAGVAAAYVGYNHSQSLASYKSGPSSSITHYSGPVDEFVPSKAGDYVVTATNTMYNENSGANYGGCVVTGTSSATAPQYTSFITKNQSAPIAVTGVVFASASHPVVDDCYASHQASVYFAGLVGIQANKVNGVAAAVRPRVAHSVSPRQLFRKAVAAHETRVKKG
jgi:hypothetical protein